MSVNTCQTLITQHPKSCVALVDKNTISQFGAMLIEAKIPLIQVPLNSFGVETINHMVNTTSQMAFLDETDTHTQASSQIAKDFALTAQKPDLLIENIASTIYTMMQADLVAFIKLSYDENDDYSLEILGLAGDVDDENDSVYNFIRPDGFTAHIMQSGVPVIIPNLATFELSDIDINPHTASSEFQAGMGFPLLLHDGIPFGVMWVMYKNAQQFHTNSIHHMQVYASHGALAYNYSVQKKLLNQWQKAAESIFTRFEDTPSLETTLQHITEGIHQSLDCDVVTLYLYDPYTKEIQAPYDEGAHFPDAIRMTDRVAKDSIVYDMLQLAEPLILENAQVDERFAQTKFLHREHVQSVVVMPLRRANDRVGVVFLNYRSSRHFLPAERDAIRLLAEQISVPVLNARLDEEQRITNQKNMELVEEIREQGEQLVNLVKMIDIERDLSNQDRDAILQSIAKRTAQVASADRVTIRLVQDEHVAALAVYPPTMDNDPTVRSENWTIREGGHSQYIVQTNKPVIISDVDDYDPNIYNGIKLNPKWRGVWRARIGLPLSSGKNAIGVMWLSFVKPRTVTETQLSAFQSFANIAFLTKSYDIEQQRLSNALEIMTAAHKTINADRDEDTILRHTATLARKIVSGRQYSDACHSHIAIVTPQSIVFKPAHNDYLTYALLQEKISPDTTISLDCTDPCLVVHVVHNNQTIWVNDVVNDPRFLPLLHDEHIGSQLSVPIIVGEKIFAVISVEHMNANSFEWYDRATLEWLASFVGQVLRNQKQQKLREALLESSQAITEGKRLSEVLSKITRQAHRVIATKRSSYDHDAYIGLRQDNTLIFHAAYPENTLEHIESAGLHQIDLTTDHVGVSGNVLLTNQPRIVHDTRTDPRAFQVISADNPPLSLMSVPIPNLTEDQPAVGVISLGHPETSIFDRDDQAIMTLFAKFAAVAIRRAREIDEQNYQRESLYELTKAAMHQVIAAHDLNNFRMIYNFEFSQLRKHVDTFLDQEETILRSINDSQIFDEMEKAIDQIRDNINNLEEAYHSLIAEDSDIPELGDRHGFPLREWLWKYHKEKHVHLQLDASITDTCHSVMPQYWLREVLKIVIHNARRALKQSGYDLNTSERLIKMTAIFDRKNGRVEIHVTNPGKPVPIELSDILTKRVVPRTLRKDNDGGRGIGLFMTGVIMGAYDGDIAYFPTDDGSTFRLDVPVR